MSNGAAYFWFVIIFVPGALIGLLDIVLSIIMR
jgi:hypothetical protein